jgi:NitT/TauT family transport system ATP-binding protein
MSSRPGRIVAVHDVPFGYPRSPDVRFDPTFAELSGQVSHSMMAGHT